jgi:hypothetical protein
MKADAEARSAGGKGAGASLSRAAAIRIKVPANSSWDRSLGMATVNKPLNVQGQGARSEARRHLVAMAGFGAIYR